MMIKFYIKIKVMKLILKKMMIKFNIKIKVWKIRKKTINKITIK